MSTPPPVIHDGEMSADRPARSDETQLPHHGLPPPSYPLPPKHRLSTARAEARRDSFKGRPGIIGPFPRWPITGAPRPQPGFDPLFDDPPPLFLEPEWGNTEGPMPCGRWDHWDEQYEMNRGILPLGHLDGRYIIFTGIFMGREDSDETESSMVLTTDGHVLWGYFDIGGFMRGIIRLNDRPSKASYDMLSVDWRGENDLMGFYRGGDEEPDGSFMRFMGDGRIEGTVRDGEEWRILLGERISDEGAKSEISVSDMRRQWLDGPDPQGLIWGGGLIGDWGLVCYE